ESRFSRQLFYPQLPQPPLDTSDRESRCGRMKKAGLADWRTPYGLPSASVSGNGKQIGRCRDAASLITFSNAGESEGEVERQGFCAGIVVGLSFMGQPTAYVCPLARLLSKSPVSSFSTSTDSPTEFARTSTILPLRLCEQIGRVL